MIRKGWQRQADTVITIIDVICLSFISANGCCILFFFCWVLKLNMQTVTQNRCLCNEWLSDAVIYRPSFEQQNIPQLEEVNFEQHKKFKVATFVTV